MTEGPGAEHAACGCFGKARIGANARPGTLYALTSIGRVSSTAHSDIELSYSPTFS